MPRRIGSDVLGMRARTIGVPGVVRIAFLRGMRIGGINAFHLFDTVPLGRRFSAFGICWHLGSPPLFFALPGNSADLLDRGVTRQASNQEIGTWLRN